MLISYKKTKYIDGSYKTIIYNQEMIINQGCRVNLTFIELMERVNKHILCNDWKKGYSMKVNKLDGLDFEINIKINDEFNTEIEFFYQLDL